MVEKKITRTYTMRIDVELFEKIENEAIRRKRSLNFIVNEKLERAYDKRCLSGTKKAKK